MALHIPNILLLSKSFWRSISRSGKFDVKSLETAGNKFVGKSIETPSRRRLYNAVRHHIRKNGHFTLVEVTGNDGESVKITI